MKYIILILILFLSGCAHRYLITEDEANTLSILNDAYKSQGYNKVIHYHYYDRMHGNMITEWEKER